MKRVLAIIIVIAALGLTIGTPHGGMAMSAASPEMSSNCADGGCEGASHPGMTDCADRCLAAGPVRAITGSAASVAFAFAAIAFIAVMNGTRRLKPSVSPGQHVSLGRSLVLERVATDVLRN